MSKEILKVPSHAKDLEETVLGALLLGYGGMDIVFPILKVEDFYVPNHQIIYNAILSLLAENSAIDIQTVCARLRKNKSRARIEKIENELQEVGGPFIVTKLTNDVVSTAHIKDHCLIIKQHSIKRKINVLTAKAYQQSTLDTVDALDLLSGLAADITSLVSELQYNKLGSIASAIDETITMMMEAGNSGSHLIGIAGGIDSIDRQTLGFNAPDFIILAATTGEGKSTLALQWAMNMSKAGTPSGFISLEMKSFQLCLKMISMETGIDIQTLRKGLLTKNQWELVIEKSEKLKHIKFHFTDKGGQSIFDLRAIIHGWVKTNGVKIVILDYIQLVSAVGANMKFSNREQELNFVSKQCKAICMELNICMVALSQMSRQEKGRPRRPVRSDLRDSGALEQDSDAVMFIWRPVYNGLEFNPQGQPYKLEDAFLLIEKYRLGRTGDVPLKFLGGESKFTDADGHFVPVDTAAYQKGGTIENFDEGFDESDNY